MHDLIFPVPVPSVDSSVLLKQEELNTLQQFIFTNESGAKPLKLELVYRASRDGWNGHDCFSRCDSISPMVTVAYANNKKVGGYTETLWKGADDTYVKDEKAFLFSLSYKEKYEIKIPEEAIIISINNNHLFRYGDGRDIMLDANCNISTSSYTTFPTSYKFDKFQTVNDTSKSYLFGSFNFKVDEIEAFRVVQ